MKRLTILSVILSLLSASLFAAPPAKEATRALARERGADVLTRIVHVLGDRGSPQPAVWRIVIREESGIMREFFLSNDQVVSEGVVPPQAAASLGGNIVPMKKVTIDSTKAFQKAEAEARAARIGFNSVNYQLRCLELSTNPAWFMQMMDAQGHRVGTVCVSASTGQVVSRQWFVQAAPPPAQANTRPAPAPRAPIAGRTGPGQVAPLPRAYPHPQR